VGVEQVCRSFSWWCLAGKLCAKKGFRFGFSEKSEQIFACTLTFADQLLPWVGILRRLFFHDKNKLYSKPKEHSPAEASHLLKYIASVKIHFSSVVC
jgi:hypothetical protein